MDANASPSERDPAPDPVTANHLRFGITDPASAGDERTSLLGFLMRQRELVAWKVRGVPDAPVPAGSTPSGMTVHGVVRHLTNVDRSWVRDVFAGETGLAFDWTDEDPNAEWSVPAGTAIADLLEEYAVEGRRCDAVVAAAPSLDVMAASRGFSLRWVLLHLIEETARHLGQLDLLREQIDGEVGEEPEDDSWTVAAGTASPHA